MWAALRAFLASVLRDRAAALLLLGAPILYSVFYPSAYSGEVIVQAPVVVVDLDRSAASRDLLARVAAEPRTRVVAALGAPAEARRWLAEDRAVAALIIPADYAQRIAQGGTGTVILAGHGAHLLRASAALGGVGTALAASAPEAAREQARAAGPPAPPALMLVERPLFNVREGYGAAVFPGVAFVIIHQTLLLGLALLFATTRERLGRPLRLRPAQLAGIALGGVLIGLAQAAWFTGFVFWLHDYPRAGAPVGQVLFAALLFVLATVAAALAAASLFAQRERPLQLGLALSLPLFFLAGLSWPVEATPPALNALARLFPTTSGLELMVGLNQMGGRLADHGPALLNLGLLALGYGLLAWWRLVDRNAAAGVAPAARGAPSVPAGQA